MDICYNLCYQLHSLHLTRTSIKRRYSFCFSPPASDAVDSTGARELEAPNTTVRPLFPQRSPGAERSPPEAETLLAFRRSLKAANMPNFQKDCWFHKRKEHNFRIRILRILEIMTTGRSTRDVQKRISTNLKYLVNFVNKFLQILKWLVTNKRYMGSTFGLRKRHLFFIMFLRPHYASCPFVRPSVCLRAGFWIY